MLLVRFEILLRFLMVCDVCKIGIPNLVNLS